MTADITPYLNRPDLLMETVKQIEKDFGWFDLKIVFSGNTGNAYTELFSQIQPHIEKMLAENTQQFYSLMYRIDLSEQQIKKAVESAKDSSFSEIVTDLILKRELQKIIIRKSFSLGKGQ